MPEYHYQAYAKDGQVKKGVLFANSEKEALEQISALGLIPYKTGEKASFKENWWEQEIYTFQKISTHQLAIFTRELATLLSAAIPIDEALRVIAGQATGKRMKSFLQDLVESVTGGSSMSSALDKYKEQIPPYYISLVRVGEASGSLDRIFLQLADFIEHSEDVRSRIRSALVYPIILLCVSIGAIAVIATFLVPNLLPIFEGTKADIPFFISFTLWIQDFLAVAWPFVTLGLVALIIAIVMAFRSPVARIAIDRIMLKLPVVGGIIQDNENGKITRSLAMLLENGIPLLQALHIVKGITGNRSYGSAMEFTIEKIKEGGSLYQTLLETGVFQDVALRLIRIGEQSGKLDEMLLHCARIFEGQMQRKINYILTWFTPLMTLGIGLGVGGLIMSVMNAILSVNEVAFS